MCSVVQSGSKACTNNAKLGFLFKFFFLMHIGKEIKKKNTDSEVVGEEYF